VRGACYNDMRVKPLVAAAIVTVIMFYAHRLLQLQYYRHCKSDLIRVVLFNQSAMCVHIANVLQVVEVAYHQVIKQITAQMLGSLNGGGVLLGNLGGGAFA
jgi:hypothetical protein